MQLGNWATLHSPTTLCQREVLYLDPGKLDVYRRDRYDIKPETVQPN